MPTIYKYPLGGPWIPRRVVMPKGARVVHVALTDDGPCLWAEVNSDEPKKVPREFVLVGTGTAYPDAHTYLGTFIDAPFVWHLLEVGEEG